LAWAYQKENIYQKSGKKDFSKYCPAKESTFFSKKVLRETCEKSNAESKGKKGLIMQINGNNLYQRKLL
jgi:hypothetical protein